MNADAKLLDRLAAVVTIPFPWDVELTVHPFSVFLCPTTGRGFYGEPLRVFWLCFTLVVKRRENKR